MNRILLILCALVGLASCQTHFDAQKSYNKGINIVPKPKSIVEGSGYFLLSDATTVKVSDKSLNSIAKTLLNKIHQSTPFDLEIDNDAQRNCIELIIDTTLSANAEAYQLFSSHDGVQITGASSKGVFYGVTTLLQLLPAEIESPELVPNIKWEIPAVEIQDEPRFIWRGFHLDAGRHFLSVDFIKKQLDVLSSYKINKFHWHLTEDQGWRIEIKKHPLLIDKGSTRKEADGSIHKGYYTQEEIREVVSYAADRYIDVIPEIEMPGHALAALSAYPHLACQPKEFTPRIIWGVERDIFCAGNDEVFQLLEDVLVEVMDLFPYEYIHLGGDEAPKTEWAQCQKCQRRISEEGLHDEHELQAYFMKRMEQVVRAKGRRMIGWDEILEGGLSPTATVMSWRGEEGGIAAANAGHDVIMAAQNWLYLDRYEGDAKIEPVTIGGFIDCQKIYNYDPMPTDIALDKQKHVLGAQTALWTEYVYNESLAEYRLYPRVLALAETAWTSQANKNYDDFEKRLNNHMVRLDGHKVNYYIPVPEGPASHVVFVDSVQLKFKTSRPVTKIVYTKDGSEPDINSQSIEGILTLDRPVILRVASVLPHGKLSRSRSISIEKQSYKPGMNIKGLESGLIAKTASGEFLSSDQLTSVADWDTTIITSLKDANETLDWGHVVDSANFRAVVLSGYVMIPETGIYYFSSDQTEVWISGTKLIDNNGEVRRFSRMDKAMALSQGLHEFKLVYLNNIYRGWASDWNTVGVKYRVGEESEYREVDEEMLFYNSM